MDVSSSVAPRCSSWLAWPGGWGDASGTEGELVMLPGSRRRRGWSQPLFCGGAGARCPSGTSSILSSSSSPCSFTNTSSSSWLSPSRLLCRQGLSRRTGDPGEKLGRDALTAPRTAWSPWTGELRSFSFPLRLSFVLCSCCFNLVISFRWSVLPQDADRLCMQKLACSPSGSCQDRGVWVALSLVQQVKAPSASRGHWPRR